jgi:hypothetical protein
MNVCNWDKWQSFRKDRGAPPWIKIHRNLMSNEQWVELSDADKGQLVSIWMLAADKDGVIPDSDKMIQRMAMLDNTPNIKKFIELGFLTTTCQPPVNQEENLCLQLDAPEEKRVEESRVEENKPVRRFTPPNVDEVKTYCDERNNGIDPSAFIDYYTVNNWMRGKNKIKDWKACVRTWEARNPKQETKKTNSFRPMPKPGE